MTTPEGARAAMARAQDKLERLRTVQPFLIDLSLRENPVGARVGQTLTDKLDLLPLLRAFGFQNILLGTLDYSDPDELEVDDDFMAHLQKFDHDALRGGWAFTDIGRDDGGGFQPSRSMQKLAAYQVPNTLLEIYLADMQDYTFAQLQAWLPQSIAWLRDHMYRFDGVPPQILINIVDGCDAFHSNLDQTCEILQLIRDTGVTGLSFEDDRGTYFPFQVGAYVETARWYLPDQKILVHMHAGAGFENASLIEAILSGADGVWGGLPKRAAIIGHASLGELLANLVRAGNQNVLAYNLSQLSPLTSIWQSRDDQERVGQEDTPILGTNAYRTPLAFFQQIEGRAQDLPPSVIGATQRYRICPVVSDPPVIRGRLGEVMHRDPDSFDKDVMWQMRRLMRRSLREGRRIAWDEPKALVALYHAAGGN
jgi:hypothetical protein